MKKKNLITSLIALSLLSGLTACSGEGTTPTSSSQNSVVSNNTSSATSSETSSATSSQGTSSVPEKQAHNITLPSSVDGAYVSVSQKSAKEGEHIVVTVVMTDEDKFTMGEVKVNGTTLTGEVDQTNIKASHYAFEMLDEDVQITVTTNPVVPVPTYKITMPASVEGGYAYASKDMAAKDDEVVVTVVMTDSTYEIKDVKLGDTSLNGEVSETNDKVVTYRFLMPEGAANITIETAKIAAPEKDGKVEFANNANAYVIGLADEANEGDEVSFKVVVSSGYELVGVSAKAGDDDVEITSKGGDEFSFTMPKAEKVVVSADVQGAYFKMYADTELVDVETGVAKKKYSADDMIFNFINADETTSTSYGFGRAGSVVKFTAQRQYSAIATHYYMNGIEVLPDEDAEKTTYSFTMPASNAKITVAIENREIGFVLNKDEHINARIYTKDSENVENPVTKVSSGETIYVEVTSTDPENYGVGNISGSFDKYSGSTSNQVANDTTTYTSTSWADTSTYSKFAYVNATTKKFTVLGNYYTSDITLTITEKDLNLYKDYGFVGQWIGYEYYNKNAQYGGTKASVTAKGDGTFTTGTSYTYLKGDLVSASEEEGKAVVGTYNKKFYYSGDCAITSYGSSSTDSKTDFYWFVKNVTEGAAISAKCYVNGSTIVIQVFETLNDVATVKGNFLVDAQGYHVNVDVAMVSGENVSETGAKFVVSKDGTRLLGVGIGSEYGTYKLEGSADLVLDGNGNASGAVTGTYTVSGNLVTVTAGDSVTYYEIDTTAMTYVVSEAPTPVESPFNSTEYELEYDTTDSYNDPGKGYISITFNDDGTLNFYGEDADGYNISEDNITYTYDAGAKTISFTVDGVAATLSVSDDFSTLTFQDTITSGYCKLKCSGKALEKVAA